MGWGKNFDGNKGTISYMTERQMNRRKEKPLVGAQTSALLLDLLSCQLYSTLLKLENFQENL